MIKKYSLACIGDCFGHRFLYHTFVLSEGFDLGRHLAWLCRSTPDFSDSSFCVKAFKDGRLVARPASYCGV